jgi:hypothetical protein
MSNSPAFSPAPQRDLLFSRRRFLRGLGACVALPLLDSALPAGLRGATTPGAAGSTGTGDPLRMAFVYVPNGVNQQGWWPTGEGSAFELGGTMQPLLGLKEQLQVVGGLSIKNARAGNDGGGDHARANATFLTGVHIRKTESADIRAGVSVDQLAAQHIGHLTRLPSLELTCDTRRKTSKCDSGYSCAYQNNISWQSPTTPMAAEANPRLVFERLFGAGDENERRKSFELRQKTQKSILDYVLSDARSLSAQLDYQDNQKLDEYLTAAREIEGRIERAELFGPLPAAETASPPGIPANYGEHMDLMYDLLVMAFKSDSTRIATLLVAAEGSTRPFPDIGVNEGHHFCSHHHNDPDLMAKIARIDLFYMQHFSRFLRKLDQTPDANGKSLLHNSMIVYGCGNSDGNRHTHDNLPIVLAGAGGGTLTSNRYVQYGDQPLMNLFLNLTDRMGVHGLDRIGDSTGRLASV